MKSEAVTTAALRNLGSPARLRPSIARSDDLDPSYPTKIRLIFFKATPLEQKRRRDSQQRRKTPGVIESRHKNLNIQSAMPILNAILSLTPNERTAR